MWGWIGIIAKSWAEVEGEEKRRMDAHMCLTRCLLDGWMDGWMEAVGENLLERVSGN